MNITISILLGIVILLMFGAGQRILDQLRLNDKQAIIVLLAIAIGIAIPPINIGQYFSVSIGGFIIPYCLCIYLLISCGWSRDLLRATIGTLLVAGIIYGLEWLLPSKSENQVIEMTYVYGIVAGVVAYALGRSRRNAFVSCIFGISTAQLLQWGINFAMGTPTVIGLGVGGAFGTYVIATLISVGLCEFLGRAFTVAKPDEQEKQFNYDTHTYDSEKNGKLILAEATSASGKTSSQIAKEKLDKEKQSISKKTAKSVSKSAKTATSNDKNSKKHNSAHKNSSSKIATCLAVVIGVWACFSIIGVGASSGKTLANNIASNALNYASAAASQTEDNSYYTVYDYADKTTVVLTRGGEVDEGDLYLSADNKLYQICRVNSAQRTAYAKYIKDEKLPEYNVRSTYKDNSAGTQSLTSSLGTNIYSAQAFMVTSSYKQIGGVTLNYASAKVSKKVGVYHTHNDESYFNPDGTDSVYAAGGIHDVGKALVNNFTKLGVQVDYNTSLHLPHNSGAYTRSQTTAKKLIDNGAAAIFDIHRDSTPRSEYYTKVNGVEMSKVRMVVGSGNANFAENKNFAYSIKAYADKVYPNFIKDIYMGKGNYNQQLSNLAMLFEFGSENIEKELAVASTQPLSKILDIVVFGSDNASSASLKDVDLTNGSGQLNVITGLSNTDTGASLTSLWVLLGALGTAAVALGVTCIFSKQARYKVARFFSETFAGVFGSRKQNKRQT